MINRDVYCDDCRKKFHIPEHIDLGKGFHCPFCGKNLPLVELPEPAPVSAPAEGQALGEGPSGPVAGPPPPPKKDLKVKLQREPEKDPKFKQCPKCGKTWGQDAVFCAHCGHSFENEIPRTQKLRNGRILLALLLIALIVLAVLAVKKFSGSRGGSAERVPTGKVEPSK